MIGIYARVSTEESARKGYSIRDQLLECRKKAQTAEVIEYVDEGISGEFLDRPALTRLREDVRKGLITKVVCLDPDRLSRKLMNQLIISEEFERRGVELVFVNGEYAKTPEGQLFYSMRGAISEFEKAKINERMSRGRREKARQGKVVKDPKIYGYEYDKETEQLVINEEEAKVVRLIFDLFTKPNEQVNGINGIAHYLSKKKIPTKRGAKVWHRQVVRQMLMNRAYIGEFYQNRWNTEGMLGNKFKDPKERVSMRLRPREEWIKIPCPAIIDEATFYHAQKLLSESRRRWAKRSKHPYLLSGLVRCGDCRNTMTGRKTKNWGKNVFAYTDRKNFSGAKHPGCGRSISCKKLDNHVWEQIANWLNQPAEISAAAENISDSAISKSFEEAEIKRLEKEIEKARAGRKRLFKMYQEEPDLTEEIRQEIRELKEREDELIGQIQELKEHKKLNDEIRYTYELMKEAAEHYLGKGADHLAFADKRELIRQVVKEIVVYEDRVEIYTL